MKARETRSTPALPVRSGPVKRWWLDRSVRAKGMIVVAAPLIALIAVTSANLALQSNERHERSVAVTASAVNTSAQQVLADAMNAETGVRGYAASDDPQFLGPYNMALSRLGRDKGVFSAAAVAEGDSHGERTAAATLTKEMAELAGLRSEVSHGVSGPALKPSLTSSKNTMDAFRGQIAALASGPAAISLAGRGDITELETIIDGVTIAGLVLGLLAGLIGVALFTSGISGRITVAAANAGRLGEGEPLEAVPVAKDELGRLADSLERADEVLTSRTEELVTARDEAVRATHAKNAFLSSTSHELRTPLNAVLGFAQLLQLSDLEQEDQDAVERILAAGRHLLALINELIDIARIESGEFSLSVEPVSVPPVVEETCQLVAPLAADRSITILRLCSAPGLAVSADRQRLSQVLVNLLSNAIKYNRAGGSITITCQAVDPGEVSLSIADTGHGIPAADLERIFDPFERLGAEQTAVEGTGIGLPLARAFAEAMHGHLTAASVVGEGTTFTLTLPRTQDLAQAPADHGTSLQPAGPDAPAETCTRILYIEDNPSNIEVVTRFIRTRPGMRLESATSGEAGLEAAIRDVPDLILLDLHLPGLRGDAVLSRLRDSPATAGVPVAVLSAEAAPSVVRRLRASGVIAYLTKPLDLAELGRLLDAVAAERQDQVGPTSRTEPAP